MLELSKLAEKDPEFYKYLQEHDRDLLGFNVDDDGDDVEDADDDVGEPEPDANQLPTLTESILRTWQKSLLEVGKSARCFGTVALIYVLQTRSLRALRKLLVAFRSAVFMNEEDRVLAWTIDSPTGRVSSLSFKVQQISRVNVVYDKLVKTTLRYTPVVLEHHAPYKTLPNGRLCVLCRSLIFHKSSRIAKVKLLRKHKN